VLHLRCRVNSQGFQPLSIFSDPLLSAMKEQKGGELSAIFKRDKRLDLVS